MALYLSVSALSSSVDIAVFLIRYTVAAGWLMTAADTAESAAMRSSTDRKSFLFIYQFLSTLSLLPMASASSLLVITSLSLRYIPSCSMVLIRL